ELAEADILYVKAVSEAGQSFVYDVTLCVDKKDEASGEFEVYTGEEGSYAYNIYGTIHQYTDLEERIFRTVPKGGKAIYKIDLPDEADRVQIGFYLRGEFTISVSADGVNYQPVLEAFSPVGVGTEQTVCLYDELENNDGNILYIMIEGHGDPNDPEDDNTVRIAAVNFTTAGVPDKPEDTDPTDSSGGSFDYEDSESSIAGESEKDSETAESTGTGSGCLGGITPAALGAGLCMAALAVIRRKKRI
ncbi:MAG: hypothetical protein IJR61_08075, partial [Clostridia bacterium]|nr:hypothetical protein [Clostridia bacterium]